MRRLAARERLILAAPGPAATTACAVPPPKAPCRRSELRKDHKQRALAIEPVALRPMGVAALPSSRWVPASPCVIIGVDGGRWVWNLGSSTYCRESRCDEILYRALLLPSFSALASSLSALGRGSSGGALSVIREEKLQKPRLGRPARTPVPCVMACHG